MKRSEIHIPEPCHEDWSTMDGSARQRFCGQCSKHVHNLSALTEPEARAVLATPDVCVRFSACADGTVRFQSRRRFLAAAAASTIALPAAAAVTPREDAAPGLLSQLLDYLFGAEEPTPEPEEPPIPEPPVAEVMGGAVVMEPEPVAPVEPPRPTMGKPRPPEDKSP